MAARCLLALLAAAVACAAVPSAAAAAVQVHFEWLKGQPSKGTPARLDKVGVLKVGPASARNVLVLNPGTSASAAYFQPLAKSIVAATKGWQVWAIERRENLLEDHSMLTRGKAGKATPKQVFDYYLGWIDDSSVDPHFQFVPDAKVAYAKRWGLSMAVHDVRRVVALAAKRGGKVVVGGHSLGGSITAAYATWDFGGKPGAQGLAGLVFIDGGSSREPVTGDQARESLDALRKGSPWLEFGGIAAPFTGLFNSTGSLSVRLDPDSRSLGQQFRLLPAELKPPVPATNAAQYGYALDTETSPPALAAAQAHLGHLAESGDPRGWDDAGELTPLRRFADMFSGWGLKGLDGTAWYHPQRLTIDARAVAAGNSNPAQKVLGLHATHGRDLPRRLRILAFGASLGGERVLVAAKTLARQSHIPARRLTLVDKHTTYAHNDPNSASPKRNAFLKKLVPYLRRVARG